MANSREFPLGKVIKLSLASVVLIGLIIVANKMLVNVASDEIVVTQDPIDGDLHYHVTQGLKNQNMGQLVGQYHKSNQYNFDIPVDKQDELRYEDAFANPEVAQYGIKVRFADDGDAYIFGSMRYEMPRDEPTLEKVQTEYGSSDAVEADLVKRVINNAVFNSGPLMSSKESSAERRSDLLWYIEDMSIRGVYKTKKALREEVDPITGDTTEVKVAEIVLDSTRADGVARQSSKSQFEKFGITGSNFTISQIVYSPTVQEQIAKQQELTMKVQIAKAKALEAQQNEITAEADGKAEATKAKWAQEKINYKEIAEAEKKREVAKLAMEEADFYKKEQIRRGEGDAARKKLVMQADGALDKKLDALKYIANVNAAAIKERNVPSTIIVSGQGGSGHGDSDVAALLQMVTVEYAKQLKVDPKASK
jgi:hypothetical protein